MGVQSEYDCIWPNIVSRSSRPVLHENVCRSGGTTARYFENRHLVDGEKMGGQLHAGAVKLPDIHHIREGRCIRCEEKYTPGIETRLSSPQSGHEMTELSPLHQNVLNKR